MIWSLEDANFFGTRRKKPVKRELVGVGSSMTRTKLILILSGVIGALAVVAFFAVPALLGFDSEGPRALVVGDRAEESLAVVLGRADGAQPNSVIVEESGEATSGSTARTIRIETVDGAWDLTGDSVAGYRVFKDFVGAREFEAVGRTSTVFGDLTIEDGSLTGAEFRVDVASIESDDPRRDAQFRGPILTTEVFPFADFTITSPIELGDAALTGEEVTVNATGELTLRDVTNEVTFQLTARLAGGEVQVAGSIDVVFEEFDITPPVTPTITVRDSGIIEFSLFFEQAQPVPDCNCSGSCLIQSPNGVVPADPCFGQ